MIDDKTTDYIPIVYSSNFTGLLRSVGRRAYVLFHFSIWRLVPFCAAKPTGPSHFLFWVLTLIAPIYSRFDSILDTKLSYRAAVSPVRLFVGLSVLCRLLSQK